MKTLARFIRITIKDRLQGNAVQGREQQGDDCDRFRHANPPLGLILYVSLPDVERIPIAATSTIELFNKLFLYQRPTYGTGLEVLKLFMFQHLTDFAYQRTKKQAFGFYIAYFALIVAIGGLIGFFIAAISPSQKDTGGTIFSVVYSLTILAPFLLALTVAFSKRIYTQVFVVLLIVLSGVFGSIAGAMLGLIPVAYLTTRENKNNGTTKGEGQQESLT
jgi:hypothetical protein